MKLGAALLVERAGNYTIAAYEEARRVSTGVLTLLVDDVAVARGRVDRGYHQIELVAAAVREPMWLPRGAVLTAMVNGEELAADHIVVTPV